MASSETPPPSIRQGVRIVPPDSSVSVEEVLLAVGEQVGHDNLSFASRMNKAVVVFVNEELLVHQLVQSGVFIRDLFVQVSPLSVPSTRITVSGVPPFIPNEALENELRRFGKFASGFKTVSLGCKDPKLKHVQSLRRQVFMFLDSPTQTLEVSFRVKYGEGSYMVYASSGQLKCFECGDVGHKRFACPHKQRGAGSSADATSGSARANASSVTAGADAADAAGGSAQTEAAAEQGVVHDEPATGEAGSDNVSDCNENVRSNVNEEQQVSVAAESLSSSQSVEEAACGSADRPHTESVNTYEEQGVISSQASCEGEEGMEYGSDLESVSDTASLCEANRNMDLYSLEDINNFLDATYKKSCNVGDFFSNTDKFIKSVSMLQRLVGFDMLDEKKRFRLKKHVTNLRKEQGKGKKTGRIGKKNKKVK